MGLNIQEQQPVVTSRTFARTIFLAAVFSVLALALIGCQAEQSPAPVSLTPTPESQQSAPEQPTPSPTPVPTATSTPPPTPSPTATPAPTPSPTPAPTPTATPTPTPAPTPTPIPKQGVLDYVRWEIGDKVSSDHRNEAIQGVQLAHDYSVHLGIPKTQSEITIHLYNDIEKLISAYANVPNSSMENARKHWESGATGIASENHFFVDASSKWYQNTEPKYRTKIIAHELIHTYQNEMSELKVSSQDHEVPEAGPRWLKEGIAEYLAYKSLSERGILSYESERNSRFVSRAKRVDKPLSEMEKREGIRGVEGSWNYILLAAELLAKNSDDSALLEYHALQNSKTTWQEAFEKAFGMNTIQFYEMFEKHKNAGFPE